MEIIERIYQLLENQDKKAYELCDKLNIQASTMSTWKTRVSDPPAKYMKAIADFFNVSLDYLLTGKEAISNKDIPVIEEQLLNLFRSLPENKKYEFIGELKGFLIAIDDKDKYLDSKKRLSV